MEVYAHFVENANEKQINWVYESASSLGGTETGHQSGGTFDNKLDGGLESWWKFESDELAKTFVQSILRLPYVGYVEYKDITYKYTRPTIRNIAHERYPTNIIPTAEIVENKIIQIYYATAAQ